MKLSIIRIIVLGLALAATSACSPSSWANFTANPIVQVQTIVTQTENFLGTANTLWGTIQGFIPADQQASAKAKFDQSVLTARYALSALQDGLQVAIDAKETNPDLSKLIADAIAAVDSIVAIINQYRQPAPSGVGASVAHVNFVGFDKQVAAIHKLGAKRIAGATGSY